MSAMPKSFSGGITVRLSSVKLEDTITKRPTVNKTPESTLNVAKATHSFSDSGVDDAFGEHDIEDEETNSHLRFLGHKQDMPFFLVHASDRSANGQESTTGTSVSSRSASFPSAILRSGE